MFGRVRAALVMAAILLTAQASSAVAEEFQGVIKRLAADSTPYWQARPQPPKGAPNVLIWVIDDGGFAHVGSFGGLIETPSIDHLADSGLRFTNFNATPLCSPSRAALLTGRNPHTVGLGSHAFLATGYPGYNAQVPKSAATIARILKDSGYATYAVGKWDHLPTTHVSPVGPYDYWPSGQGFDRFYGFLHYEANQFTPAMWLDHEPVNPGQNDPTYHVSTDLADRAIEWIEQQQNIRPEQPFFMYWATGAVHGPLHVPEAYIDKYRGQFDMGWNRAREIILERQKKLGVVPADAELPAWPEELPLWDSLTAAERKMAARAMEVFAAQMDHADHEFGRVVKALEERGELDNTVILVLSDNGATAEASPAGARHYITQIPKNSWEESLKYYDSWGGPETYPHYPSGWAAAGNTPFRYYKRHAHQGGTQVPLIVHWPKGISDGGGIRHQYHFIADLFPTLLDIIGIEVPAEVDGVAQQRVDGVSMQYTLDAADAPTRKKLQYYEMMGNRAIWSDGWKAVKMHNPDTWSESKLAAGIAAGVNDDGWELYRLDRDFNERFDLAAEQPGKLAEMKELFDKEAWRNNVYPLLPDFMTEMQQRGLRQMQETGGRFTYQGRVNRIPHALAPPFNNLSHIIEADLDNAGDDAEGVVFALGGVSAGYALYIREGYPVFVYNQDGDRRAYIRGSSPLPDGPVCVQVALRKQGQFSARVALAVNGQVVGEGDVATSLRFSSEESLDIGSDLGSNVSPEYSGEGRFTGAIRQVSFRLLADD